jgi:hypothetical protein
MFVRLRKPCRFSFNTNFLATEHPERWPFAPELPRREKGTVKPNFPILNPIMVI